MTSDEAWAIISSIRSTFVAMAGRYDESKYWPGVYLHVLESFRDPISVTPKDIRDALLWKWGHLGKARIPGAHERLIEHISENWLAMIPAFANSPQEVFAEIDLRVGGRKRFITVAFLSHLVRPSSIPIIDQYNFRAVNKLLLDVSPGWRSRIRPDRYADIELIAGFIATVIETWRQRLPASVPTPRELDKFLMMYGKALKRTQ